MPRQLAFYVAAIVLLSSSQALARPPVTVASGSGLDAPRQPQVAVSTEGTIHLVFGVGDDVHYTRSTDNGMSFAPPQKAFNCPNLSLGMRRGPRVAAANNSVVVTAIGGALGKGRDGDIMAWRRLPAGDWAGPVRVNDVPDAAREGLHAMASGTGGMVWCCWLDLRSKRTEIQAARSADGGATWAANVLVYRSPGGSVCECCHPSIAIGADGRAHVLFRNSIEGHRDMYLASSDADGTFSDATKLGAGTWPLKACPMDGGMLALDPAGRVHTSWRRQDGIFLTSGAGETQIGRGQQPWIAATNEGGLAIWTEIADGPVQLYRTKSSTTEELADRGRDPVIVPLTDGRKAFACWERVVDKERSLVGLIVE